MIAKKDYQMIAKVFYNAWLQCPEEGSRIALMAEDLANAFQRADSRFDRERFLAAAEYDEEYYHVRSK